MHDIDLDAILLQQVSTPAFASGDVQLQVLRLDRIHPVISGNKWFKLRYYLEEAQAKGRKRIVTFGGAWSNHIVATAAACRLQGLECTGIIRGERPAHLSPTLQEALQYGMQLLFISRHDYALKKLPDPGYHPAQYLLVPEGGYGEAGARGAAGILAYAGNQAFSHIICATGTGTMMAGLINASRETQQVIGISVLRNNLQLEQDVRALLYDKEKILHTHHAFHFGGYAKHPPALIHFMNEFYAQTGIPTDIVYTGKLFYAVHALAEAGYFDPGSRLLLIHSGGLQGNRSLAPGTLIF